MNSHGRPPCPLDHLGTERAQRQPKSCCWQRLSPRPRPWRTSRRRCRPRPRPTPPRPRLGIVGVVGKNQRDHRHFAAFAQNQSHRLLDLRRPDVEPAGQRHRKIVRAEADHVDAVERENLVELIERALGLDLRAGDGPIIGGLEIIAARVIEPGAVRPPAAIARAADISPPARRPRHPRRCRSGGT